MSDTEDFASASEGESDLVAPAETKETIKEELEAPTESEKKPQLEQTAPAPEQNSGWSGWGSFLTSAVAAVQESLQSDLESLAVSAKGISNTVIESLDSKLSPTEGGEQAEQETSPRSTVPTGNILKSTETVLSVIDQTLDFTSDLLGNAVLGGYRQLEQAKSNVEKAELFNQGKEVGQLLIANGVTALEAIGSVVGAQAARSLAEARGKQLQHQQQAEVDEKPKQREIKLADLFEDNCGNAHLQALEMLAAEATMQVNATKKDAIEKCTKELEEIDSLLNRDTISQEIKPESTLLGEKGIENVVSVLESLNVLNKAQILQLKSFIETAHGKLVEFDDEEKREQTIDIKKLLRTQLAEFCEKSCEQSLRIAEIVLMLIAEDGIRKRKAKSDDASPTETPAERGVRFSKACFELTVILQKELAYLHQKYSEKALQLVEETEKEGTAASMELDYKEGSGFVQDATEHLRPIIKLMVVKSIK